MEKTKIVFIVMVLFAFNLMAYSSNPFSVGAVYQPKLTSVFSNTNSATYKYKYGFETGLRLTYAINNKMEIDSRLLYTKYMIECNLATLPEYVDPIFTKDGKMIYDYTYSYLSIPISINYNFFSKNKVTIGSRVGFSIDKFISKKIETIIGTDLNNTNPRNLNLSIIAGLPITYKLTEKVGFLVEPQFNTMLFDNYKNDKLSTRLYGFGMNFGIIINN